MDKIKICELCSEQFKPRIGKQKFCSGRCRNTYKNRKASGTLDIFDLTTFLSGPRQLTCDGCGKVFLHPRRTRFCSRLCRGRFHQKAIRKNADARTTADHKRYLRIKMIAIKQEATKKKKPRAKLPLGFDLTHEHMLHLWDKQNGCCAITGFKMTHEMGNGYRKLNASVDRIDNAVGYIQGNIRLVCRMANQMRFDMSDGELLGWCRAIIQNLA